MFTSNTTKVLQKINKNTKLGDLRKIAKSIKMNHVMAMEIWSTGIFLPRLLAILIMDHKQLSVELINRFDNDMQVHTSNEKTHLMDWLMANQLTKSRKNIAIIESWAKSPSALQRRAYWYYQGRLRWTGQKPPENTGELLAEIERSIQKEVPEVQWAMNFTAGWIGVYDHRSRCIKIGEENGLYKDEVVAKGCTPNYLPEFIAIEAKKRNL